MGGFLSGIASGMMARHERQQRLKDIAFQGGLQQLAGLASRPDLRPEAREDVLDAYFEAMADYSSGGKGTKAKGLKGPDGKPTSDPIVNLRALTGEIMGKTYASGQAQPGQPGFAPFMGRGEADPLTGERSLEMLAGGNTGAAPREAIRGPLYTQDEQIEQFMSRENVKNQADEAARFQREATLAQMKQKMERAKQKENMAMFNLMTTPDPTTGVAMYTPQVAASLLGMASLPNTASFRTVTGAIDPKTGKRSTLLIGADNTREYIPTIDNTTGAEDKLGRAYELWSSENNIPVEQMTPAQKAQAELKFNQVTNPVEDRMARQMEEENKMLDANVQTVVRNPAAWFSITPKTREKMLSKLEDAGFTAFGKQLPSTAIKEIAQSESAVIGLRDLRKEVEANADLLGPAKGLLASLPAGDFNERSKILKAKIDLIRQRVGKALEGGVLRKEDEQKYKYQLATMLDTEGLALGKIDNLIADIERDIRIGEDSWIRNGYNVGRSSVTGGTPQTSGQAQTGGQPVNAGAVTPGSVITLRDGTKRRVTKVLGQGQFETEPVQQ